MLPLYLFAVVPSSCDNANWVTAHGAFEENAGKVFDRDGYTNMLGEFNKGRVTTASVLEGLPKRI
jgi:hypothetical protein